MPTERAKCRAEDACGGRVVSKGLCSKHYTRFRKYGDPNVTKPQGIAAVDPRERFDAKYLVEESTGCWLWTGAKNGNGWAMISIGGKSTMAHRYAYEEFVGPIPEGDSVTRTCEVNLCVCPDHLALKSNDPEQRFWEGVKKLGGKDGCWTWQPNGFVYRVEGKPHSPRRYAWALLKGEAGEALYSLCGNGRCVKPEHAGGIRAKFWTRVRKAEDGCWYWMGAKLNGYPHLTYEGKSVYAHRLTYEWDGGVFREGFVLAHTCDHSSCVRPEHLEQISYQEMVDRRDSKMAKSKDKQAKGAKKASTKTLKEKRAEKQAKRDGRSSGD